MKTLIGIQYCAAHQKSCGATIPAQEHAEWLEECVDMWDAVFAFRPHIVICSTGLPSLFYVHNSPDCRERDVMWRVFKKVRAIFGIPEQPGLQVGSAWCIRMALEATEKLGYDYLLMTCEDVVPAKGAVADMLRSLDDGHDYIGAVGNNKANAQFFACRANAFAAFNPAVASSFGTLEDYLGCFSLAGKRHIDGYYRHTHDHSAWCRWRDELLK